MKFTSNVVLLLLFTLVVFSVVVHAVPTAPDSIVRGNTSRATFSSSGNSLQAQAGNITGITASTQTITKRWQGFWGNVTGGITLATSGGDALYQWGLANPAGEIYAANGSTPDWTNIHCVNFTTNTSVLRYNLSQLNEFIGYTTAADQAQDDTFNGTFNQTYGDDGSSFRVGSILIDNAANCSMVTLFNSTGLSTTQFKEVLLTDNESIIFAALLEQDSSSFDGSPADFEMIVGVNGTLEQTTRTYYFFVELS